MLFLKKALCRGAPPSKAEGKKAGQYLYFKKMKQENKKMSNFSITLGTFSITVSDVKRRWDKKLNRNVLHANVQCSEEGKELMLCINGEYLLLPNATEGTESKDIQRDPQCEKNDCVSVTRGDEENKDELAKKYFWAVPDQELCPSEMREAFAQYPHYIEPRMGKYWRELRDNRYLDKEFKPRRKEDEGEWTWAVGKCIVDCFSMLEKRKKTEWAPFEKYWVVRNLRTKNAPLGDGEKGQKLGRIFEDSLKEILSEKKK